MRKIKISEFDTRVVINGLSQMLKKYPAERGESVSSALRFAIDIHKTMKPNKSKRVKFPDDVRRTVFVCLNDWRNEFLSAGNTDAAAGVGDVLCLFIG